MGDENQPLVSVVLGCPKYGLLERLGAGSFQGNGVLILTEDGIHNKKGHGLDLRPTCVFYVQHELIFFESQCVFKQLFSISF